MRCLLYCSCCAVDFKVYRHDEPENPCKQPCGSKTYDFTTEVCCEGVVHHLHEYTQCCGSAVIDSRYYECCGRKYPWSITGNKRCCGDKELFNIRNYECINNTVWFAVFFFLIFFGFSLIHFNKMIR